MKTSKIKENKKESHYVIINEWVTEKSAISINPVIDIVGVRHTLKEAKAKFKERCEDEKLHAEENGYIIYENSDKVFDAGMYGEYAREHTRLYIEEVE